MAILYILSRGIIYNKRGLGYSVSASGKEQITAYRKERFIEQELPLFLSTLLLLNVSMDEVKIHYDELVSKNNSVEL